MREFANVFISFHSMGWYLLTRMRLKSTCCNVGSWSWLPRPDPEPSEAIHSGRSRRKFYPDAGRFRMIGVLIDCRHLRIDIWNVQRFPVL
ncbi:hypothetical protein Zmor_027881 [Zophobas morio]|uniref:Uncharacterized protein n=1 Tax=Zophobas morio TaxID=2755281 RepID=A0AA38HQ19_9CUCU|nr:hypothetical protein Zmor_027881 [Zophobas morio]